MKWFVVAAEYVGEALPAPSFHVILLLCQLLARIPLVHATNTLTSSVNPNDVKESKSYNHYNTYICHPQDPTHPIHILYILLHFARLKQRKPSQREHNNSSPATAANRQLTSITIRMIEYSL